MRNASLATISFGSLCLILIAPGCQSPIRGTWIQTSEAIVNGDTPTEKSSLEHPTLLVFKADGTSLEYEFRNGKATISNMWRYETNGALLIYHDDDPHFSSEITERFAVNGDRLVIDSWEKDGTVRCEYERLD